MHFRQVGSVLIRDSYCTRDFKMSISIAKEAFNRKMSLLKSKLNIELRKKLVRCYFWSIALYGSDNWIRKLERKYLENFKMWFWRRMEKIKCWEELTNEQVLEHIGKKRTIVNNSLRIKANWIGHILRRNCLLYDAI